MNGFVQSGVYSVDVNHILLPLLNVSIGRLMIEGGEAV